MTPATKLLDKLSIHYALHAYESDPNHPSYGLEAAEKMGTRAERIFKTLLTVDDSGRLLVAVVSVESMLDLKALAAAAGTKKTKMANPADAEKATGYVVGGISPIGQRKRLRCFVDSSAQGFETVFVSGGRRGLEIELAPSDLLIAAEAKMATIARD